MQVKNLPTLTARYWSAILAASMCGANTGDFLARNLHLGHTRGLLPLAMLFSVILWAERRAKLATEAYYWLAVIVLRTAATNLADLVTHDLKLGYGLVEAGLTLLLVVILLVDFARSRSTSTGVESLGRQGSNLPATDATYWMALLTAGILGTAIGDYMAVVLGLGYGSVILGTIYGIVLLVSMQIGGMAKAWYWASIVAARSAGTTMGDLLARHQGLLLSTACTGLLLASIVVLWKDRNTASIGDA
jgi:uncharacterized membrane-anchored protein